MRDHTALARGDDRTAALREVVVSVEHPVAGAGFALRAQLRMLQRIQRLETLDLLEELLQDYTGTVLLVSHDRAFLDNVVTQILVFEGEGRICTYAGGYDDNRAAIRARTGAQGKAEAGARAGAQAAPQPAARAAPAKKVKLGYQETRELAALPDRISALEQEHATLQTRLADPALYRGEAAEIKALQAKLAALDTELAAAYARWEALEARVAEINAAG